MHEVIKPSVAEIRLRVEESLSNYFLELSQEFADVDVGKEKNLTAIAVYFASVCGYSPLEIVEEFESLRFLEEIPDLYEQGRERVFSDDKLCMEALGTLRSLGFDPEQLDL